MSYKNNEGYPDPTASKAVQAADRMQSIHIKITAFSEPWRFVWD